MHVEGIEFALVALAILIGAVVQGSLGFGMVLLAFPVLVFTEPLLLPRTTLVIGVPMVLSLALQHAGRAVWREVGLIALGRLPGVAIGAGLLAVASARTIGLLAGTTVLVAVALSLWAPAVERTNRNLLGAGVVSSVFGTTVSIGGPPLGLLYQHESGNDLRATVTAVMLSGAPLSLAVLTARGEIGAIDLRTGLALAPFALVGSYSARWVIPHVDLRLRPVVLVVCAVGAVLAMGRLAIAG